jgi:2-keto-4-pentenoate hydratase/2-oxohepta-3-ene-1,7-dioic acid hydratase in catechol pathway
MKVLRYLFNEIYSWGVVDEKNSEIIRLKDPPYEKIEKSRERIPLERAKVLVPAEASKIILAGLNYKDHAEELGMKIPDEPVIFMKPNTSLIADGEEIIYPASAGRVDYEAELAIVIKKRAKDISEKEAPEYVLGYTCLNDVTARDLQKKDGQWTRAKSFDTFCPTGPWLETEIDPSNLRITSFLNGHPRQDSSTANFIFDAAYLVSFISRIMPLLPGDIISTGTPPGVGEIKPGDVVEVSVQGIGRLTNRVALPAKSN